MLKLVVALATAAAAGQMALAQTTMFAFDAEEAQVTARPQPQPAPATTQVRPLPSSSPIVQTQAPTRPVVQTQAQVRPATVTAPAAPAPPARTGSQFMCGRAATNNRELADRIVQEELGISLIAAGSRLLESNNYTGSRVTLTIYPRTNLVMRYQGSGNRDIPLHLCKVRDGVVKISGTTTNAWGSPVAFAPTMRLLRRNSQGQAVIRVEGLGDRLSEHSDRVHFYEDRTPKRNEYDNDYTLISR